MKIAYCKQEKLAIEVQTCKTEVWSSSNQEEKIARIVAEAICWSFWKCIKVLLTYFSTYEIF